MYDNGVLLVGSAFSPFSDIKSRLVNSGLKGNIKRVNIPGLNSEMIGDSLLRYGYQIVIFFLDDIKFENIAKFIQKLKKNYDPLLFFVSNCFNSGLIDAIWELEPSGILSINASGPEMLAQFELSRLKKEQEIELKRQKDKFEARFDHSLDGLLIFDLDGKNLGANNAALLSLGYSEKEFLEKNVFDIFEKDDHSILEKEIADLLTYRRQIFPKIFKLKDKSDKQIFVEVACSLIRSKDQPYVIQAVVHNISEQWNAAELKRALFENSVDAIIIIDLDDQIIAANKAVERIFGYAPCELVNKPFPDDMRLDKRIYEKLRQICLSGQGIPGYETKRRTKSGKILNVSITISPIRDIQGEITSISFHYRDMTEYKKAEDKLSYQSMLLENIGDAIIATDEKLLITAWNSAAQSIYMMPTEEVIGRSLYDVILPRLSSLKKDSPIDKSCFISNVTTEMSYIRKNGEQIIVEGSAIELKDENGSITGYVNVSRDVTKRYEALMALKQSEEKFRTIFEYSPLGIIITVDLKIVQVNRTFLKMFGYDNPAELLGKNCLKLVRQDIVDEKNDDRIESEYLQEIPRECETYGMKKDGSEFPVYLEIAFLNLPEGKANVTFVTDFTEVKAREGQIRCSLLEKEILLREIHHRVKNNLQIISSLLSLQSEFVQDEQFLKIYNESRDRIKTMALLHEKLYQSKNFSRINFAEYINELVRYISRTYESKDNSVDIAIDADDIHLPIDTAIPCGLIISELVTNAFKYAYAGLQECKLDVGFKISEHRRYCLSVYDNGCGFPENLDFTTTNSLGLQLVNGLVDQLNGEIELKRGNGTLFAISFPVT
ncbi:MAG: PAS domain S-box protein [Bacteroidota bacterium]|nr:PAS domain S-box protein [Bacteroidota bacterium]